jgi:hypothetical protein
VQQQQESCEIRARSLALCTKSGGGGLAFRPQKTLSCANFEYLSAFARAEQKKSHSPGRYSKALISFLWLQEAEIKYFDWFRQH